MKYEFFCKYPPSELLLGIERPDLYSFSLNGTEFDTKETGFWCDHSMKKTLCPENAGHAILEIPAWRGVSLGVGINGSVMTQIPWPPFRLDLSGQLHDDENDLVITVFEHRRNSHGPFYLHEKWPDWTGPSEFKASMETERQLVPCGLMELPVISF